MATIDVDAPTRSDLAELRKLRSQVQFGNSLLAVLCVIEIISVARGGAFIWIPVALVGFVVLLLLTDPRPKK